MSRVRGTRNNTIYDEAGVMIYSDTEKWYYTDEQNVFRGDYGNLYTLLPDNTWYDWNEGEIIA
jgi:regulation of enolase protein 1 (concanavalin A-like superfamily)